MALHQSDTFRISIHAPRAGSDDYMGFAVGTYNLFQSTLPVRGATRVAEAVEFERELFQSTLPVRGATARSA